MAFRWRADDGPLIVIYRLRTFQPPRKTVVAIPVNDPLFLSNNAFCFDYRRKFGVLRTRDFISNYQ